MLSKLAEPLGLGATTAEWAARDATARYIIGVCALELSDPWKLTGALRTSMLQLNRVRRADELVVSRVAYCRELPHPVFVPVMTRSVMRAPDDVVAAADAALPDGYLDALLSWCAAAAPGSTPAASRANARIVSLVDPLPQLLCRGAFTHYGFARESDLARAAPGTREPGPDAPQLSRDPNVIAERAYAGVSDALDFLNGLPAAAQDGAGHRDAVEKLSSALDDSREFREVIRPADPHRAPTRHQAAWGQKFDARPAASLVFASQYIPPEQFGKTCENVLFATLSSDLAEAIVGAGLEIPNKSTLYRWRVRLDICDMLWQREVNTREAAGRASNF